MINWPCIVKHSDDPELLYISSQAVWENVERHHGIEFSESDHLIDSSGNVFALTNSTNNYVSPEANGDSMSLVEILGLVKAHAAQIGSCCVAKLYAPTISDALEIVKLLSETDH